ncbi:hypothetical protein ACN4GA_31265, partial [Raoultella terrigena]
AGGVERRACRAGPEGVSRWRRIIERSSMKSPAVETQKTAFWAGSLNSGARLGLTPEALNGAPVAPAPKG